MWAKTLLILFFFLSTLQWASAQIIKELPAVRRTLPIKIDGLVDDSAWKEAPVMTDLIEFRPNVGRVEDPATKTVAYLLYDDLGIYFGGMCYERTKDSIASELVGRDGFGTNDYVGLIFDTYYDKLNGFEYFVTPLNEQWDAKMSPNPNGNSEDFSWNAVWQSGAVIHSNGWSFEMFIPFSAIRFPKKDVQTWGLNITRRRRKTEQQFTWNPINPNVSGFLTQEGIWKGISNIKPPLRLQLSPYFSTYLNHFPANQTGVKDWTTSVNGGMDLKYGINQAITLDMTLIPDFGQVQSDNQVLNLTPFEVRFDENRSFFTEGTELFGKGNLFYSRRVGGQPMHYWNVYDWVGTNERVVKNPAETKLINATKISGRLQSGLGVGFFNALTAAQHAEIEDDMGNKREIETSPLINYNIIVLDQSLKNNSSVSLINTNVLRSGSEYDANVTAALFELNDKKNTWNVGGKLASSNLTGLPGQGTKTGYAHNIHFGKISGKFNFNFTQDLANSKYNHNDLGYFNFNNYLDHYFWMGYRWIKPSTWYNNLRLNFNLGYTRRFVPSDYQNAMINVNANGQLKNLWYAGALVGYEPEYNDFYEPRVAGRVFRGWSNWFYDAWVETNSAKKYMVYTEFLYVTRSIEKGKRFEIDFFQRYRFNNKFSVSTEVEIEPQKRNVGFADISGSDIIFGRRDRSTVEASIGFKYNFNSRMGIRTTARHYWSKVEYDKFFTLQNDGSLMDNTTFSENVNQNVNFFNVDMVYTWQFAPGSFINIVWKDAGFTYSNQIQRGYFKNFGNTIDADQNNNLSLKVIYFIDYHTFRTKLKNRSGG